MNGISRLAALSVGGESRFRQLALQGLTIHSDSKVLDLCCRLRSNHAIFSQAIQTGLDASPLSIKRAQRNVPQAEYVEAFAEDMPIADNQFDIVHTSAALHEMESQQLQKILK